MRFELIVAACALFSMLTPQTAPTKPSSITQTVKSSEVRLYVDEEGYAVLSALLAGDPAKPDTATIAIRENTGSYACQADNKTAKEFREALKDYTSANETPWRLQKKLILNHPYLFVSDEALNAAGGFLEYRKTHPDIHGIVSVSAVGFNANKTAAVVFQSFHCGSRCGSGQLVAFRKINGHWTKLESSPTGCGWIS